MNSQELFEIEMSDKLGYEPFMEFKKKIYREGKIDTLDDISIASLIQWLKYKPYKEGFHPNWLSKLYLNAIIPLLLVGVLIGFLFCSIVFSILLMLH